MGYKTINGLMKHLRQSGIDIGGAKEKRQLTNSGYFHGYKGYRFMETAANRLPFAKYKDIEATIEYDSRLKAAIYGRMMYIETAVKNVALNCVMLSAKSEHLQDVYDRVISSYRNCPNNWNHNKKQTTQKDKLALISSINRTVLKAYANDNHQITHYVNSGRGIPLWAVFEILMMGDFGLFLSRLDLNTRGLINAELGINRSVDTNKEFVYRFIYALKDLRNAVAHNGVVFDTRFKTYNLNQGMKNYLANEMNVPYINFKTIGDYIILMVYFLKVLGVTKTDIKGFIREIEKIVDDYQTNVDPNIFGKVVHPDFRGRMKIVKNSI